MDKTPLDSVTCQLAIQKTASFLLGVFNTESIICSLSFTLGVHVLAFANTQFTAKVRTFWLRIGF